YKLKKQSLLSRKWHCTKEPEIYFFTGCSGNVGHAGLSSDFEAMSVLTLGIELVTAFRLDRAATTLQNRVTELFEETREDVYRYLLTLGLRPSRAQETVQEVFLRLYTSLKKGEDIQNPRGWIFRVAHNYGLKVRARQASEDPFEAGMELQLAS